MSISNPHSLKVARYMLKVYLNYKSSFSWTSSTSYYEGAESSLVNQFYASRWKNGGSLVDWSSGIGNSSQNRKEEIIELRSVKGSW